MQQPTEDAAVARILEHLEVLSFLLPSVSTAIQANKNHRFGDFQAMSPKALYLEGQT